DDGSTTLDGWLRDHDIENITVVGIATDHCVRATALDAADAGYEVKVVTNLTVGVSETGTDDAFQEMDEAGGVASDWPGAKAVTGELSLSRASVLHCPVQLPAASRSATATSPGKTSTAGTCTTAGCRCCRADRTQHLP